MTEEGDERNRDDAYLPAPLPDAERAYGSIDGRQMKGIVNDIVAISRKSRDERR